MLYKSEKQAMNEVLLFLLKQYDKEAVESGLSKDLLENLIFKTVEDKYGIKHREIAVGMDYLKLFDLSDISWGNVKVAGVDFTGTTGVKINPQLVYGRDFSFTNLCDTEIIGSFDDCQVIFTKFGGSNGAVINPQTVRNKELMGVSFADSRIDGDFKGAHIIWSDFTGSSGAKINPQTIHRKKLEEVTLNNAEIEGPLDGAYVSGTDFRGCNNVHLDLDKVKLGPKPIHIDNDMMMRVESVKDFGSVKKYQKVK